MSYLKPSDEGQELGSRAPDLPFEEPAPLTVDSSILPEPGWRHRLKFRLLGRPLHSEALEHETLGKPTALAVFASDNLSSAAYATEQILVQLVPVVGVAAFALVVPTTGALLVVLGFLILSYRQTIEAYPKAASAYLVTKDNFGLRPALLAAVALLTAYVLTVAVSVAAGSAALASAFPGLTSFRVPILAAAIVADRSLGETAVTVLVAVLVVGLILAVALRCGDRLSSLLAPASDEAGRGDSQ